MLESELRELAGGSHAGDVLAAVSGALRAVDNEPPGVSTSQYRSIARQLEALPAKVDAARLFQVDLIRPPGATLGSDLVAEIERGVALLHRLQPPSANQELQRFRTAFAERYEEREVPLAEALEADLGLGSAPGEGGRCSPLLDGLDFPEPERQSLEWGDRERWLLQRVARTLQSGEHEIVLAPADIDVLATPDPAPLPDPLRRWRRLSPGRPARPVRPRTAS